MTHLPLPSFEIHGFRSFDHLTLQKLGRVTLVVGKNNVGKTSLLEALSVYANQGSPLILWSVMEGRNEARPLGETRLNSDINWEDQINSLRYLFHGREDPKAGTKDFRMGPLEDVYRQVTVRYIWIESVVDEQGSRRNREAEGPNDGVEVARGLAIQVGLSATLVRLTRTFSRTLREQYSQMEIPSIFLSALGLSNSEVEQFWDNVTLGPSENDVLDIMRIIQPDIDRINLIGSQTTSRYRDSRIPIVKVNSIDSPFPLKSLGDGMNRLFGIALAMVNAKDGILLIDEIESGLHYSVLPEMWHFVFKTARRLNVQVFATTHSWDCIAGFQQAAQESDQDGVLIRLENKKSKIVPTIFEEEELAIATREQIEVR